MNEFQYSQHKLQIVATERTLHLKTINDIERKIVQDKALLNNLNHDMSEERKKELIRYIANNETRLTILIRVMEVLNEIFDEATTMVNNYV